jgi:hypothetical protein
MVFVFPDAHWRWEWDGNFTGGQGVVKNGGWQLVIRRPKLNAHRREVRLSMVFVVPDAHWHWEHDGRFTEGQGVVKSGGWQAVIRRPKLNAHRCEVWLLMMFVIPRCSLALGVR